MISIPCAIVLCRPEESRNIGSVCRAMKTMACTDLRIVGYKNDYSDPDVCMLAVHAADIWESAAFFEPTCEGLKAAIADTSISAGTTRRMGQKRKSWGMTPEQFAITAKNANPGKVALVFGNERTGLTDIELNCCSLAVNIPSNEVFPSLNLSHAVQIMTYTLFRTFDEHLRGYSPVNLSRLHELVASISGYIDRIGLYQTSGREENTRFLEGILARAALSEKEAQKVEQLFQKIAYIKTEYAQDK